MSLEPFDMKAAALAYAAKGYQLIACHTPLFQSDGSVRCSCSKGPDCPYRTIGKHPRTPNGLSDASSDPAIIAQWWTRWPNANIGWLPASANLAAFDLDSDDSNAAARALGLFSEPTMECQTPNGTHRYYQLASPLADGSNVAGIILRSGRGYVMLPPSLHASGKRYYWADDAEPLPMPPRALDATLKASAKEGARDRVKKALSGEKVTEGGRHAAIVSVAGHLAATRVSEEVAHQLVQSWNLTNCLPPKEEAEVAAAVAYAYTQERKKFADVSRNLLVAYAPTRAGPQLVKPTPDAEVNPLEEPLPGILEDIAQWSYATAPQPVRAYSVAAALAIGSTVCGRRYATNAQNYSTLYVLVIGKSGTGKEHARVSCTNLLRAAGATKLIGPNEWTSRAAVWSSVHQQPQSLAIIDEFGQFLGAATGGSDGASMKNGVLTGLMELFGRIHDVAITPQYATLSLNDKQREAAERKTIERPALSFLGLTTPEEWYDALKSQRISSGFLNRFLVLEASVPRGDLALANAAEPPAAVVAWATALLAPRGNLDLLTAPTLVPPPVRLQISDEAHDAFFNFRRECNRRADALDKEKLGELPMRANEQAMRLALISALARDPAAATVDLHDATWGIRVSSYLLNRLIPSVQARLSDSPIHALRNQFLAALRDAGERGLTAKEMMRCRVFRGTAKRDRDETIEWVQHAGHAGWKDVPHKGAGAPRTALVILAIEADEHAA